MGGSGGWRVVVGCGWQCQWASGSVSGRVSVASGRHAADRFLKGETDHGFEERPQRETQKCIFLSNSPSVKQHFVHFIEAKLSKREGIHKNGVHSWARASFSQKCAQRLSNSLKFSSKEIGDFLQENDTFGSKLCILLRRNTQNGR